MYEDAKRYRTEMREKAARMAGEADGEDAQNVDASSWTPPDPPMNGDKQTGMRPISRSYRKRGGKVEGAHEKRRADRKPRASGGRSVANAIATTNEPDANAEEYGRAHVGAYRDGGRARAKRMMGGPLAPNIADQGRMSFQNGPSQMSRSLGIKTGGKVKRASGGSTNTAKQSSQSPISTPDQRFEQAGGVKRGGAIKRASGGKTEADNPKSLKVEHVIVKRASGGATTAKQSSQSAPIITAGQRFQQTGVKKGGRITAKERDKLPKKDFGEPGKRAYPMPDRSHAANAKARASQMEAKGKLSKSTEEKIDAKANKVLGRASGGVVATRGDDGYTRHPNPNVPDLRPHEGSWFINHRETGKPAAEMFRDSKAINNVNFDKYEAVPANRALAALNKPAGEKRGGKVREAHAKGGRAGKGKMSVNIVIAGGGHPQAPAGGMPPPAPHPAAPVPMPQQGMPMGMAPPMMPPGMPMGAGMPPGMPPGMMGRPGMPPMPPGGMGMPGAGMPPMMPRKRGGSVKAEVKMEDGAGGGLGRLEKIRKYGDNAHP